VQRGRRLVLNQIHHRKETGFSRMTQETGAPGLADRGHRTEFVLEVPGFMFEGAGFMFEGPGRLVERWAR